MGTGTTTFTSGNQQGIDESRERYKSGQISKRTYKLEVLWQATYNLHWETVEEYRTAMEKYDFALLVLNYYDEEAK